MKKWLGMQIAERASGLDRINRAHRSTFNLATRMQNKSFGANVDQGTMDEDMAVSVGDQIHYHQGGNGKWAIPLLAAALLLGPLAAVGFYQYLSDKDPPPPVTDTDTDTTITIGPDPLP